MIKERKQLECLLSWVLYFGKDGRVWAKVAAVENLSALGQGCCPLGTFQVGNLRA